MSSGQIDKVCSHVARILREQREKRNFSMTTLADRSGVSRTMVRFIEKEDRNPTLQSLLRLANALEIDLGEVIQTANTEARKKTK